jgi:hypothetical protein
VSKLAEGEFLSLNELQRAFEAFNEVRLRAKRHKFVLYLSLIDFCINQL